MNLRGEIETNEKELGVCYPRLGPWTDCEVPIVLGAWIVQKDTRSRVTIQSSQ